MADNTDEEHIDNPTNIQSENPSDQITPTTDKEIINPNQDTENMEIHKHPPHVLHKKKWFEYALEFAMLFLAVFLGFVAENIREHQVEEEIGKQYAINLYEDLKKDTASINYTILQNDIVMAKLDTFFKYSNEKKEINITNGMLYYYGRYITYNYYFTSNNTTIEQMKGSGNLRLIGNVLSKKINEYGNKLAKLENDYSLSRSEYEKMEALYFKLFDMNLVTKLFIGREANKDSTFKLNLPFINDDPKLMKELGGWVKFESMIYGLQNNTYLVPLKQEATELIDLLKNKYRLE